MIKPQLNVKHEMGYMCHSGACYICNEPWQAISWKYYFQLLRDGYWKRIRIRWIKKHKKLKSAQLNKLKTKRRSSAGRAVDR